jgi:hypothetical protein
MNKMTILCLATAAVALALPARAQESVLYSFNPESTGNPEARLLLQKNALFGTTEGQGGRSQAASATDTLSSDEVISAPRVVEWSIVLAAVKDARSARRKRLLCNP